MSIRLIINVRSYTKRAKRCSKPGNTNITSYLSEFIIRVTKNMITLNNCVYNCPNHTYVIYNKSFIHGEVTIMSSYGPRVGFAENLEEK